MNCENPIQDGEMSESMLTPHDLATIDPSTLRGVARCECGNCGEWDHYIADPDMGICDRKCERRNGYRIAHIIQDSTARHDTCPAWRGER